MRLFLDQMLGADLAELLRTAGHDVVRACETRQARADDADILARAIAEARILVTLDEHFGDWTVLPLARHPGVLRLKLHPTTTEVITPVLTAFLGQHEQPDFDNQLVILSENRSRWIKTG